MDIVYGIVVVLHLLGWAVALGYTLSGIRETKLPVGVEHGVGTALATGLLLVGLREAGVVDRADLDMAKIAVKLGIAILVLALVVIGRRRPERVTRGYLGGIAALIVVNVTVAVLW